MELQSDAVLRKVNYSDSPRVGIITWFTFTLDCYALKKSIVGAEHICHWRTLRNILEEEDNQFSTLCLLNHLIGI